MHTFTLAHSISHTRHPIINCVDAPEGEMEGTELTQHDDDDDDEEEVRARVYGLEIAFVIDSVANEHSTHTRARTQNAQRHITQKRF